jgi:hypothetical protein
MMWNPLLAVLAHAGRQRKLQLWFYAHDERWWMPQVAPHVRARSLAVAFGRDFPEIS